MKPTCENFAAELGAKLLQYRMLLNVSDIEVLSKQQRTSLNLMLSHILSSQMSLDAATRQLENRLSPFFAQDAEPVLVKNLEEELLQARFLVSPRLSRDNVGTNTLNRAIDCVTSGSDNGLLDQFVENKRLGTLFFERAKKCWADQVHQISLVETLTQKLGEAEVLEGRASEGVEAGSPLTMAADRHPRRVVAGPPCGRPRLPRASQQ